MKSTYLICNDTNHLLSNCTFTLVLIFFKMERRCLVVYHVNIRESSGRQDAYCLPVSSSVFAEWNRLWHKNESIDVVELQRIRGSWPNPRRACARSRVQPSNKGEDYLSPRNNTTERKAGDDHGYLHSVIRMLRCFTAIWKKKEKTLKVLVFSRTSLA